MVCNFAFTTVIFDLDGVVTRTAKVHSAAWKIVFDNFLKKKKQKSSNSFKKFSYENDYLPCVDGKPRYEGVQSFLKSRNIKLPRGNPSDPPGVETVCGLGNKKNKVFRKVVKERPIEIFKSTLNLIRDLKANGIHVGLASSSKNCRLVLKAAELENHFETCVDGVVSAELGLKGKPESDIFIKAAENLGAKPSESVIVEDAVSGVKAGKNGLFGLVIGLARKNNAQELLKNGADIVLDDFEGVSTRQIDKWFRNKSKSKPRIVKSINK